MLPISLTFQGIYSYQDRVTIDFKSLTSAGMFGIFGSVGSGKSTILDAISLVLYDQIERLGSKELRNIINLRSNEVYIEFDFLADKENNQYKFSYQRKFDKKREEIKPAEKKRYIWNNEKNDWQPIDIEAKDLLNISYANFKRTIILPQGKFQDFLHLKGTERTEMMIELFNLENYDLEDKLRPIKSINVAEFLTAENSLKLLENVTEENLLALKNDLKILDEKQKSIQENLNSIKKIKDNLDNLEKLDKEIKKIQKELYLLESQEESILTKKNILEQYKQCKELFANLFENNEKIRQNIIGLENEKEKQIQKLKNIEENLEKTAHNLSKAEQDIKLKPEIQEKLDDFIKIKEIAIIQNVLQNILPNIENQTKQLHENKEKLDKLIQKNQQCKDEITNKEKEKPQNIAALYEIQKRLNQKDTLGAEVQKAEEEITLCENKIKITLNQVQIQTKIPLNVEEITTILAEKIAQEELKKDENETNLTTLIVKQQLQIHAEKLVEGEPCPVCGATHHPDILFGNELADDIKNIKKNIETHKNNIKKLQEINAEFQSSAKNRDKYIQIYHKKIEDLNDYDAKYIAKNKDYNNEDKKEIDKKINAYKIMEDFVNEKRKEQQKIEKDLATLQTKKEEVDKSLQNLEIEKATKTAEIDTKVADLKHLKNYKDFLNADFETRIKAGKDKLEKLEKDLKDAQINLQNANNEKIKCQSDTENTLKNIEKYQKELIENQKEILENMQKSDFDKKEDIEKILKNQMDIDKTEKEINLFYENIANKKGSLSAIITQMQGQNYEITQHQQAKTDLQNTEIELAQIKKDFNLTEANIKKMQIDFEEKIIIAKKFEKIKQRKEDIETMENLFRSKGFAKYVSTAYLENLCFVANKRFRIFTRQQLTLELEGKEDNKEFYVCDFLHEGRKRSVKTLSGGQTFQASLALALALAETVNAFQYAQQNFFFMDEGFGSLDDDALSTVFQTLQTLREENRIVGIISHVEKLKEEIPTFLKVEIDKNGGSSVKMIHN